MANTKSALKQWRASVSRRARNRSVKGSVRGYIAAAATLIGAQQLEPAKEAVSRAVQALDKAAEKKVLDPNNTARRKSRLVKKLNGALQAAATPAPEAASPTAVARTTRRRTASPRTTSGSTAPRTRRRPAEGPSS